MPDIGTPEGIALTRRIMRHVVGIYFEIQHEGRPLRQFVHTAFLFSVEGRWMLMTAGHCVTDIRQEREQGGVLVRCKLIDTLGEGARYGGPVPFAYDESNPMHIGTAEHIDYGVLFPPHNTCQLLAANNIHPFDEDAWDAPEPDPVLDYFLLGFPAEINQLLGKLVNVSASMFRLRRYPERPEDFPEHKEPLYFYGRVIENPLWKLWGVSGGPIVALSQPDAAGTSTYHLVALQSKAMGDDIKGMLMPPLGALIQKMLRREPAGEPEP